MLWPRAELPGGTVIREIDQAEKKIFTYFLITVKKELILNNVVYKRLSSRKAKSFLF